MKKKTIVAGIMIIMLIGIVSGSFIPYFGQVQGEIEVTAPIFYASDGHPLESDSYWTLGINEYESRNHVSFTGGNTKWFISAPLKVEYFYEADYHMYIEAESDSQGQIDAEIYLVDNDGLKKQLICYGSAAVFERNVYEITCHGDRVELEDGDRFAWILSDGANSIKYTIYVNGETKIEVEV